MTFFLHLTEAVVILSNRDFNDAGVWSPDSRKLAVAYRVSSYQQNQHEVSVLEVSTMRLTRIDEGADPQWFPDSRRILCTRATSGSAFIGRLSMGGE